MSDVSHHRNLYLKCLGLIFHTFEKASLGQGEGASQLAAPRGEQGSCLGWDYSNSHHHTLLTWVRRMESILPYSWIEEVQGLRRDNNQRLLWLFLRTFQRENISWVLVSFLWLLIKLTMGYNVPSPGSPSDIYIPFLVRRQEEGHFTQLLKSRGSVFCVALPGGAKGPRGDAGCDRTRT